MAGSEGEEDQVDDNLIHGCIFIIERADETDIARLYADKTSVSHAKIESAKSKKHSMHPIKSLRIGDTFETIIGTVQTHRTIFYQCHHVEFIY